jgi:cytochrome c553
MESDMKIVALSSALHIAFIVIAISAPVRAQNAQKSAVSEREVQAKIEYCKTCPGLSGQGYRGSIPMPRLAGQQSEYLEDQLRAFVERRRTNSFMSRVAGALSLPMQKALASHFSELNPKPLGGAAWPQEKQSTNREFPKPTLPHALPATVCRLRAMGNFLGSQVSSMTTSQGDWRTGAESVRSAQEQIQLKWKRSREA